MRKMGSLEAVIYFVNHRDPAHSEGYILLAPYTECPTPEGYSREAAECLADVDKLQKRLIEQEMRTAEFEANREEWLTGRAFERIKQTLKERMVSSATSPYERDFIDLYLQLREEKRDRHRQRFLERTCYLTAREMDSPKNRRVDEERVNLDRVHF